MQKRFLPRNIAKINKISRGEHMSLFEASTYFSLSFNIFFRGKNPNTSYSSSCISIQYNTNKKAHLKRTQTRTDTYVLERSRTVMPSERALISKPRRLHTNRCCSMIGL